MNDKELKACARVDISDRDVYEAMKEVSGYLDITPEDFKEVYARAYAHALSRLMTGKAVDEVMTREVASVSPETPLAEVAALMAENAVSGVPVTNADGALAGVISEKDFLAAINVGPSRSFMELIGVCLRGGRCLISPVRARTAADIMTKPAISIPSGSSVLEAAELMNRHRINRLPVVRGDGKMIGIVSRADILFASPSPVSR